MPPAVFSPIQADGRSFSPDISQGIAILERMGVEKRADQRRQQALNIEQQKDARITQSLQNLRDADPKDLANIASLKFNLLAVSKSPQLLQAAENIFVSGTDAEKEAFNTQRTAGGELSRDLLLAYERANGDKGRFLSEATELTMTKQGLSQQQIVNRLETFQFGKDNTFENFGAKLAGDVEGSRLLEDWQKANDKVQLEGVKNKFKVQEEKRERSLSVTQATLKKVAKEKNVFAQNQMLERTIGVMREQGLDPSGLERVLSDPQSNIRREDVIAGEIALSGGAGGSDQFSKSPPVLVNLPGGGQALVTQVLDKGTGDTTLQVDRIGGELISKLGETPKEISARKIKEAGGVELAKQDAIIKGAREKAIQSVQGKGFGERAEANINDGITSAATIPMLVRNLELLKDIQTGGPAALKIRAKQILGTETGTEAELSNALKTNVLKQLKPTFGAAFTAQEGALLADIEAGFGKSTAGNIALMNRALIIMRDRVERGKRHAKTAGDNDAIIDMDELMTLSLSPPRSIQRKPGEKLSDEQKNLIGDF